MILSHVGFTPGQDSEACQEPEAGRPRKKTLFHAPPVEAPRSARSRLRPGSPDRVLATRSALVPVVQTVQCRGPPARPALPAPPLAGFVAPGRGQVATLLRSQAQSLPADSEAPGSLRAMCQAAAGAASTGAIERG
jgi:hypothetical protein